MDIWIYFIPRARYSEGIFSVTSECHIEKVVENYFPWNKRNNPKGGSLVVWQMSLGTLLLPCIWCPHNTSTCKTWNLFLAEYKKIECRRILWCRAVICFHVLESSHHIQTQKSISVFSFKIRHRSENSPNTLCNLSLYILRCLNRIHHSLRYVKPLLRISHVSPAVRIKPCPLTDTIEYKCLRYPPSFIIHMLYETLLSRRLATTCTTNMRVL